MLQRLAEVPDGVQALDAVGVVTKRDYEDAFTPLVDEAWCEGTRLRLLYECGPRFARLTAGALWADARLGLRYLRLLDGCAVVSDKSLIRGSTRRIGAWMPCPVRVFGNDDREQALEWLSSLPRHEGVSAASIAAAYLGGLGAVVSGFIKSPRREWR